MHFTISGAYAFLHSHRYILHKNQIIYFFDKRNRSYFFQIYQTFLIETNSAKIIYFFHLSYLFISFYTNLVTKPFSSRSSYLMFIGVFYNPIAILVPLNYLLFFNWHCIFYYKGNKKITEQSSKGKVKTHMYKNRQNQSTTGKHWKP